ncbi:MAG: peptide-binding protein [Nitrospinota bacterium]
MWVKRVLLLFPITVILFLLQSFFWVPTYENQTKGSPKRLTQYIEGSIGDASILNPVLSADSASATINNRVFEGLIDRDRDLSFRGRLAERWEIFEEAYLLADPALSLPGGEAATAEAIRGRIESARASGTMAWTANVRKVEIVPPGAETRTVRMPPARPGEKPRRVKLRVSRPARVKMTLGKVDQEFFDKLAAVVGKEYLRGLRPEKFVEGPEEAVRLHARSVLPPVEHNPVILFHLRKGVRFHDGHEFDAGDVKFTYESIMDPRNLSPRIPDYEPVKAVEVLDRWTVRIVYKRLYSPAFGTWGMGILPEHLLNRKALAREARERGKDPATFTLRDSRFNRHPIGVGPFKFVEWKSDEFIRLARNEDYWEGAPNYREYIYRILPDPLGQEMSFYAGTVDGYGVQPHQVARLKDDPNYQNFSGLSFGYTYLGYNLRRPLFRDRRVRRALGMAINVDEIIRYVLYGQAEPITGPFVKQTDYYNHDVKPLPYDPEGALRLLEEAGWRKVDGRLMKDGKPFEFTLITNQANEERKAILAIAQNAWKKLGIKVNTAVFEWSVFIRKRVNQLNFDALVLGWSMGIDPDLYQIWHSSQAGPFQLNFVGYNNPEADDLILKIRREYDHQKQVEYTHRLHRIIYADQPYTFLYVRKWTALLDRKIAILENGRIRKITPTKTGNYMFDFNRWVKLPQPPRFQM